MNANDLAVIRTGAELAQMLPVIKADAEGAQKAIVNSVLVALKAGDLNPEFAQQKWIEFAAYTRMVQRMEGKIRMGVDNGEKSEL